MDLQIRTVDIGVILVFLLAMVAVGWYFARRNDSTEKYFVGNRAFSGWVIGLSMLGTIVSSMTFLALPAAAFALDWRQMTVNLVMPFVAIFAIVIFIPFFRRAGLTSAFEYLGDRFGPVPRLYGMVSFIAVQLIRMAQMLFLVALPIQFLTGLALEYVIILAGLFIAFYTIAGGIEAVVWTDVIQALILIFGGVLCFVMVAIDLPGGVNQIIDVGSANDKFSLGSYEWNLSERTFWTVAILGIVNWLAIFSGNQNMVQRYASARSMREARKATIIYTAVAMPMWAMFFFIGTALFVYYSVLPEPAVSEMQADQVLPYFILTRMPAGIAGIIVAAVIAASMSSLDSGINAIATVTVVDLMKPYLAKHKSDRFYLLAARLISGVVALLMVLGAIGFAHIEKESINDLSLMVASVFGGCLMGLFMLGFFTQRVDGFCATTAIVLAVGFNIYLSLGLLGWLPSNWMMNIHSYWVGALVNLFFITIAYGLSLVRSRSKSDLSGLTVWTLKKRKMSN